MLGAFGRIDRWHWLWRPVGVCAPVRTSVGALWELPIPYHREKISCKGGAAPHPFGKSVGVCVCVCVTLSLKVAQPILQTSRAWIPRHLT